MQAQKDLLAFRTWNRKMAIYFSVFAVLFVGLEYQFKFVEMALGQYLVWQNEGREKSGRGWLAEKDQTADGAGLERTLQLLREEEREKEKIQTLGEVLDRLSKKKTFTG